MAVTITAMAGAAVLLGIQTSVQTTRHGIEQTVAQGLALQLMDEISGAEYDDIVDFNGRNNCPPKDTVDIKLGNDSGEGGLRNINFRAPRKLLDRLRRKAEVFYVDKNDFATRLSSGQTSNYRAAEVSVYYIEDNADERELARLRRLFTDMSE